MQEADAKLSNREIAVLRWTADGKTSGEISRILNISERTVNFHINDVVTKLNAVNKTSATVKAAMIGLL
ncbi:MAG: LuxR C-terminal-related transcriptional regulator [Methylobacter sp.]|nr:LuxR C-terminal-related transcriptional regulator [Methylobacter sp.]